MNGGRGTAQDGRCVVNGGRGIVNGGRGAGIPQGGSGERPQSGLAGSVSSS